MGISSGSIGYVVGLASREHYTTMLLVQFASFMHKVRAYDFQKPDVGDAVAVFATRMAYLTSEQVDENGLIDVTYKLGLLRSVVKISLDEAKVLYDDKENRLDYM